jgi:tetratricopeptide (TPR) repeat protein
MRHVKLFLASGNSLKKDRDEIMLFLANKNQYLVKHGIFLELVRWEFLSSSFSNTRKQDDFNKELEDSDIFTCLIFDRIGQYTREEFDKAYEMYKAGKNPKKFYLYFKTLPKGKREEAIEVLEFRHGIEKEEQIYREYKTPDQLKLFLNQNLDEDMPEMLKEVLLKNIFEPDAKPITEEIPDHILDHIEDADKMLSKNLTEEALTVYQEALKEVNKRSNPRIYGRIQLGQGICYVNLCYSLDQEKNLLKGILKFEEALEYLEYATDKQNYLLSMLRLCSAYNLMGSIRDRKKNLSKAIELSEKIISLPDEKEFPEIFADIYRILGACYKELMVMDSRKDWFDKAQSYFQQALALTDKDKDSELYTKIAVGLANSYCFYTLLELDPEKKITLLRESIRLCDEALLLDTYEKDAILYVTVLDCISNSYNHLNSLTREVCDIQKAVEYNKKELEILQDYENTVTYLTALSNYSMNLIKLYDQTKQMAYLTESIATSEKGLKKTTLQTQPIRFSKFHVNIGVCYTKKAPLEENQADKIQWLQKALEEFALASHVFTKSQFLIGYKSIRNYEAGCYLQLSKIENKEENLRKAQEKMDDLLACYEGAQKDGFYEAIENLQNQINQEKGKLRE